MNGEAEAEDIAYEILGEPGRDQTWDTVFIQEVDARTGKVRTIDLWNKQSLPGGGYRDLPVTDIDKRAGIQSAPDEGRTAPRVGEAKGQPDLPWDWQERLAAGYALADLFITPWGEV